MPEIDSRPPPRPVCTPENHCPSFLKVKEWEHPATEDAGSCSEGCCDRVRCTVCGFSWLEEVAQ